MTTFFNSQSFRPFKNFVFATAFGAACFGAGLFTATSFSTQDNFDARPQFNEQTQGSTNFETKTTKTSALTTTTPDVAIATNNWTPSTTWTTTAIALTTSTLGWATEQAHATNWNTPTTLTWGTWAERA